MSNCSEHWVICFLGQSTPHLFTHCHLLDNTGKRRSSLGDTMPTHGHNIVSEGHKILTNYSGVLHLNKIFRPFYRKYLYIYIYIYISYNICI